MSLLRNRLPSPPLPLRSPLLSSPLLSTDHNISQLELKCSTAVVVSDKRACVFLCCQSIMACRSINLTSPLTKPIKICSSSCCFPAQAKVERRLNTSKLTISRTTTLVCSAVQESSSSTSTATATATATAEAKETKELKKAAAAAAAKPKPPAKAAAAKSLPQLMEEDVIPPLKATFDAQDDLSEIQVSFRDNRLEGSFMKSGTRYSFWAFFPDGNLTGPKGFSLSSYGSGVSTVEPFLIDEKKITGKHVVFWVEKRLAAQGILPVWKE